MEGLLTNETVGNQLTKDSACPSLTFKQRLIGFISCIAFGYLISLFSIFRLFTAIKTPQKFALIYTLGNICSLGASFFLFGPKAQWKRMMKKKRYIVSIFVILFMAGTITFFFFYNTETMWHKWLMFGLLLGQMFSMFWYTLTFIPFGRFFCKKICKCCCKKCFEDDEEESSSTDKEEDKA